MARRLEQEPQICLSYLQGFNCHPDETVMLIDEWSLDGAHPGCTMDDYNTVSFYKYVQEVWAAFNAAARRLSW